MTTTLRSPRLPTALLCWIAALLLPVAAGADRPSLIDLDAKLTQVIDALCGGDPAACGTPAPVVAGQVDFDSGTYVADFVSASFEVQSPGASFSFAPLRLRFDSADVTSLLADAVLTQQTLSRVDLIVPDPQGPGNVTVLRVEDVSLDSLEVASDGSLAELTLSFSAAQLDWLGSQSSWNDALGVGSGCTVPPGEKHLALAGNDPSLLLAGDVEASFALGLDLAANFSYARTAVPSSACYLRTLGLGGDPMQPIFRRLSPLSDTFATQLHAETIEIGSASVSSFRFLIDGAQVHDEITLETPSGTLTTRQFDPNTGQELGSVATSF